MEIFSDKTITTVKTTGETSTAFVSSFGEIILGMKDCLLKIIEVGFNYYNYWRVPF